MANWRFMIMLVLLITASGCESVKPWERGTLAKKHMSLNPHPLQNAQRTHVQNSREAASGGDTNAGGGCGCY